MTIKAVSLTVRGEQITYFARQNLLEHGWRRAMQILQDNVPGLDAGQAAQVLSGEQCFIDNEDDPGGILLVDDTDSDEWKSDLNDKYGGTCKIGRGYYRPYAVVDSFGTPDLEDDDPERLETNDFVSAKMLIFFNEHRDTVAVFPADSGDYDKRAMHYAWHPETDRAQICKVNLPEGTSEFPVLFEEVDDPPFWMPELSPQEAVLQEEDLLRRIGYQSEYGSLDLPTEKDLSRITYQAKLNFSDAFFRFSRGTTDAGKKLDEFLQSTEESTPEHFEERRATILKQNDDLNYGYRSVDFGEKLGVREVPNGPLIKWALNRGLAMKDQGPDWNPVSMSGLKMAGDDPVHTDWVTGAGLESENFYEEPLKTIQNDLFKQIQKEELGFTAHVLVAGKVSAVGVIKHCTKDSEVDENTIAVIPNASIRFDRIAREAGGVIALEGGAMSHLAVNGLEMGQVILRDPDAKENYPEGTYVRIDVENGRVLKLQDYEPDPEDTPNGPKM